jgi:hypothetical protein
MSTIFVESQITNLLGIRKLNGIELGEKMRILKLDCKHEREEGQPKVKLNTMYCCRICHGPRVIEEIIEE